jgi:hypothetical protein
LRLERVYPCGPIIGDSPRSSRFKPSSLTAQGKDWACSRRREPNAPLSRDQKCVSGGVDFCAAVEQVIRPRGERMTNMKIKTKVKAGDAWDAK